MNYNISEEYTLPSLGKIYDVEVNPVVRLRSMTVNEEMKRLSKSDRQYKIMAEILDDCIVSNLGISTYDLCIADFQFLVHKLRVATYGTEYPIASKCPFCGITQEDSINLDDIPVTQYSEDILNCLSFEIPVTQHMIELRFQTPRIIDDVALKVKDFKKKNPKNTIDQTLFFNLKSMIKKVDDEKPDPLWLEQFIQDMPMRDMNIIEQHAKKLADGLGLSMDLECECNVCGLVYKTPFRITNEFFRPTVDV